MKKVLFVGLLFSFSLLGQNKDLFIVEHHKKGNFKKSELQKPKAIFYEDSNYVVTKKCHGEFGGFLTFKKKNTGEEYQCGSACAVIINKLNGKYFVTNTLAHLQGSSEVVEIENPESLEKATPEKDITGFFSPKSRQGTKTILDVYDTLTLASFVFDNNLYHIITDFKKTFLAKIVDGKFKVIQTISEESLWTYDAEPIKTTDNHYLLFLSNNDTRGYIDIFENKITIYSN